MPASLMIKKLAWIFTIFGEIHANFLLIKEAGMYDMDLIPGALESSRLGFSNEKLIVYISQLPVILSLFENVIFQK